MVISASSGVPSQPGPGESPAPPANTSTQAFTALSCLTAGKAQQRSRVPLPAPGWGSKE